MRVKLSGEKKLFYLFFGTSFLMGSIYFYLLKNSIGSSAQEYCAFCDEKVLNQQKFYEDELVLALYTHKPILPGHFLIIPKNT